MQIRNIYIGCIAVITVILLVLYFINNRSYQYELEKISILEGKYKELEKIRSRTTPCDIKGFNDPRSCYFGSNYRCSWNENAQRCDLI